MKRFIFSIAMCLASISLFSQTYKLRSVFENRIKNVSLSYWDILEESEVSKADTFSLWGYQFYTDAELRGYEVEYFKGNPEQMFNFIKKVAALAQKYRSEDRIQTYISGVKVRTFSRLGFKYTYVYDKEGRDCCVLSANKWGKMLDEFIAFCRQQNIQYSKE